MNSRFLLGMRFILSAIVLTGSLTGALAAPLPGGASTLAETYQDWSVNCQAVKDATQCLLSQAQNSSQSGQRVLAVQLHRGAEGNAEGELVMPFGLNLSKGASIKIDEAPLSTVAFSTCLPGGCIAPLSFNAKQLGRLKTANNLQIMVTGLTPTQPLVFKVSLKGFGKALERIVTLTK